MDIEDISSILADKAIEKGGCEQDGTSDFTVYVTDADEAARQLDEES
jgi:hypothetical protein